MKNVKRYH